TDVNGCPKPYSQPPYTEFYSSAAAGGTAPTGVYLPGQLQARIWLATTPHTGSTESRPLLSTDSTITLCTGGKACTGPTQGINLSPTGTIVLDDEAIDYSAVTCYASDLATTVNCQTGTIFQIVLTVDNTCPHTLSPTGGTGNQLCRGQRQGSGLTAAVTHNVNDPSLHPAEGWAWLATPKWYSNTGAAATNSDIRYGARINTFGVDCAAGGPGSCDRLNVTNFLYGDNTAAG